MPTGTWHGFMEIKWSSPETQKHRETTNNCFLERGNGDKGKRQGAKKNEKEHGRREKEQMDKLRPVPVTVGFLFH